MNDRCNDGDTFKMQSMMIMVIEEERGVGGGSRDNPAWHTHTHTHTQAHTQTHTKWWVFPELMLLYALMSRGNTQDLAAPSYSFGFLYVRKTSRVCVCVWVNVSLSVRCLCFCLQVPVCMDAWTHASIYGRGVMNVCICVWEGERQREREFGSEGVDHWCEQRQQPWESWRPLEQLDGKYSLSLSLPHTSFHFFIFLLPYIPSPLIPLTCLSPYPLPPFLSQVGSALSIHKMGRWSKQTEGALGMKYLRSVSVME